MNYGSTDGQRGPIDRRRRPTSPLDAFRLGGQRAEVRRREERHGAFFVDWFDTVTLAMIVTLLCLTIADGVLTIELLDTNSEEINPFMQHLLTRGHHAFLLGKYVLTAGGLPLIVVYKHYPLFGTRFRVGFLLPIFIGLYVALISYQVMLLEVGRVHSPPIAGSDPNLTADSRSRAPTREVFGDLRTRTLP
jgi:hypothetical protein